MNRRVEQFDDLREVDPSAALRGFFGIMQLWNASDPEEKRILGEPEDELFSTWKSGEARHVSQDTLRRIGYVAGIFKALQIVYSDARLADGWVRTPNRHFAGQTPMERMSAGDVTDLACVRAYVDAARGPWS